mgnify:CR=1 FL=1
MPICPTSAETGAEQGGAGFGLPTPANFKLRGLSAGLNIGVSKMCATGDVYDLKQIGQFPGTYTKLDASVALGGGRCDRRGTRSRGRARFQKVQQDVFALFQVVDRFPLGHLQLHPMQELPGGRISRGGRHGAFAAGAAVERELELRLPPDARPKYSDHLLYSRTRVTVIGASGVANPEMSFFTPSSKIPKFSCLSPVTIVPVFLL